MNIRSHSILLAVTFLAATACKSESPTESAPTPATNTALSGTAGAGKVVKVSVGMHGFDPSSITVAKGENVTMEFTRTEEKTCADKVVFPDIGISKDLPLNKPVAINVPTDQARRLTFQCGMGMYRSAVLVQ
jgi:plastocyanin domain-containing protein